MSQSFRSAVVGVDGSAASMAANAWASSIAEVHEVHVDRGEIAVALHGKAADTDADLIVVGTRGLGPATIKLIWLPVKP